MPVVRCSFGTPLACAALRAAAALPWLFFWLPLQLPICGGSSQFRPAPSRTGECNQWVHSWYVHLRGFPHWDIEHANIHKQLAILRPHTDVPFLVPKSSSVVLQWA